MIRILLILAFIATITACNESNINPPKDMLTEDQMVEVLVAMHLAEARAEVIQIPRDSIQPLLDARYAEIFNELDMDTAAFNRSFAYYERNPEKMDSLYQKVIDNLVEREATYRADTTIADTATTIMPDTLPAAMPVDSLPRRRK